VDVSLAKRAFSQIWGAAAQLRRAAAVVLTSTAIIVLYG